MARGLTRADTEDPLLNVRLTATVAGLDTSITTASRSGGTYLCADVPPGTVTRRATKAGFTPTEVVVDHTAGDTTETSSTMTPRRETADAIERDLRNEARRVLENVRVKTDSAQIREEAVSTLQAALDVIQERMPETPFVIEGHTDAQGSEEYNERLSEHRADALGMAPGRRRAR